MSFNKIKKVILGLILFFTIYKTIYYFYIKSESIKYYFINQEVKKISLEYNKIISSLVAEWKNTLTFLEEDSAKTHQELSESNQKLDNMEKNQKKTNQELAKVKSDNIKTHQKLEFVEKNHEKTNQELAEINNTIKSMMSLMQKGLT